MTFRPLPADRYALLIGVREASTELPSFVHAESDTEVLARTLQAGGFAADKVDVLTQTRGQTRPDLFPEGVRFRVVLEGGRVVVRRAGP